MRIVSYLGLLAGLIILTLLLIWGGIVEVVRVLIASGWSLLWLPVVWFPSMLVTVVSWRLLFLGPRIPPFRHLLTTMWMGRAINTLLPVATIGGEVAKARLISLWGGNAIEASASVVVDKTIQAMSVICWGLIGIALLFTFTIDHSLIYPALLGTALLSLGIIGFIVVQHAGIFGGMSSFFSKLIPAFNKDILKNHAHDVDRTVRKIYRKPGRIAMSVFWRTVSLILESGEVWLACYFFNHTIGIADALLLRSMICLLNSIMFFIPNAYGIQEGGYILLGKLTGLTPELSLALSLATRIRELIIDLPGFLIWQFVESKRFMDRKRALSP